MNKQKQILKIEEKRLRLFKEKNNDSNYTSPPSEENGNIEDDPETSNEIIPRTIPRSSYDSSPAGSPPSSFVDEELYTEIN